MNTRQPTFPSLRLSLALLLMALASMAFGAVAGTLSLVWTVLASIVIGLGIMVAISVKGGSTTASPVAHLAVSVGIICVPLGAIVTVFAR